MEKLKAALSFGGILTKENIEGIISYFGEKELAAGMYFSCIGKVANEIAFCAAGYPPGIKQQTNQWYREAYIADGVQIIIDCTSLVRRYSR